MIWRLVFLSSVIALASARADWPFPQTPGTEWRYTFNREGEPTVTLSRKIISGDATTLQLQTTVNGATGETSTLQLNDLPGPQPSVFSGKIAGLEVKVTERATGDEDIEVTAGKFRAHHFRGEQSGGRRTVTERWFADGIGIVKETAVQRSPTGALLARNSLELLSPPPAGAAALKTGSPELEASLSTSSAGDELKVITDDALQIVARWRVFRAPPQARLRAVWVAEETGGVAPRDYKVDEAVAEIPGSDGVGALTLSRPADGWASGRYRIDIYLNDQLVKSLPLTIAPTALAASGH